MSIQSINYLNPYGSVPRVEPTQDTAPIARQNQKASETELSRKATQAAREAFIVTLSREAQTRMEEEGCQRLNEAREQRDQDSRASVLTRELLEKLHQNALAPSPQTPPSVRNANRIVNIIA